MRTVDEQALAAWHARSLEAFTDRVRQVGKDQWGGSTPCPEWDVRTLVNHVVVEDLWTPPLVQGRTIAEVGDRFDGDHLGEDPLAACETAAQEAAAAVSEPGALRRTVQLSFGETPCSEYVWQLTADHLIHSWDLARAIGGNERLDPELIEAVADWFTDTEAAYRAGGAVGPRAQTPPDADRQTRLLAAFGRRP